MSDLLPIVPGCRCLAFDPNLTHPQECVAVEMLTAGAVIDCPCGNRGTLRRDAWRVDSLLSFGGIYSDIDVVSAQYLMRIDGHKEDEQDREEVLIRVSDDV